MARVLTRGLAVATVAAAVSLGGVAPASAGTVRAEQGCCDRYEELIVRFDADPGEANDIRVVHAGISLYPELPDGIGAVALTDTGAPLTAEAPCTAAGPAALCVSYDVFNRPYFDRVRIDTGDGDDVISSVDLLREAIVCGPGYDLSLIHI